MAEQFGRGLKWPVKVTIDSREGVPVVVVAGRVGYASAGKLTEGLEQASTHAPDSPGLVVDMTQTDYISSAGVQALEVAASRVVALVLVGPPEPVRVALDLAGLPPRVTIASTVEAAIQSLGRASTR